ncbi:MAG: hypothetical protein CMG00_06390 [Candidatus Marinimicrobia bacterium]|nr:hypothetical protein [Candidatus Neomarinimicrobiota bacterium]|tara:strand:+ start:3777 stop:4409 length:633 start_codon:yes stop_codon:yes gene_type:complete
MEETIEKSFNDLQVHKSLIKDSSFNSSIEFLENEIKIVNSSINQVGISISKIAKSLFEIKKLIKNNYWVKLTDSGIFNFSGRVCRDLALAHEKWLFNAKIPEYVLAEVSPRTLAKIGNIDLKKRINIIKILKEGNCITEARLNNLITTKKDLQFDYNNEIKKAIDICNSLTQTEKLSHFQTIMIINVKQKEEIKNLKKTIFELKRIKSVT